MVLEQTLSRIEISFAFSGYYNFLTYLTVTSHCFPRCLVINYLSENEPYLQYKCLVC